jgi:hypothetical protein
MGHSIMKGLPHAAMTLRYDFTGTGGRRRRGASRAPRDLGPS